MRDQFTSKRGAILVGALAVAALGGCARQGNHSYVPLPEPKEPTKLIGALNDAAGCKTNDDSCRTQLGRGILWGGAIGALVR